MAVDTEATRSAAALIRSLDDMEARLTASSSWVDQQTELKRRHERVSAIACTSAEAHVQDMARLAEAHKRRRALPPAGRDDDGPEALGPVGAHSLAGRRLASVRPGDSAAKVAQ